MSDKFSIDNEFSRKIRQVLLLLLGTITFSRVTNGGGVLLLIILSFYFAFTRKIGWFIVVYMMSLLFNVINATLIGNGILFRYASLIAIFSFSILMIFLIPNIKNNRTFPIGGMFLYLGCSLISSLQGYCPQVSFLKLILYFVFILGLYFSARMISDDLRNINLIRASLLAFASFSIIGSVLMMVFPSIGYMSIASLMGQGYTERQIIAQMSETGGINLFRGVMNHSQTLASMLVLFTGWTICDMLFAERKLKYLHIVIILGSLPLFYMTRSRTALFGIASLCFIISIFGFYNMNLPMHVKMRIRQMISGFIIALILVAVVFQIKNKGMTRWIRKTEDLGDSREIVNAVVASRMGFVEQNLYDFNRNWILGSGFQVSEEIAEAYRQSNGIMFSAPVEKGILPLVVLGEGGLLGAFAFLFFLIIFYSSCIRLQYISIIILFTSYMIKNMSEATFFSVNGGGINWIIILIGGFVVDMYQVVKRQHHVRKTVE